MSQKQITETDPAVTETNVHNPCIFFKNKKNKLNMVSRSVHKLQHK